jgi:hypothetical protein
MAVDATKRRIGRLTRQIARTNETQIKRREEVAKLKAKSKK